MGYDIQNPAFLSDPSPFLAAMRDDAALVRIRIPLMGQVWVTTNDATARTVLKDADRFARNPMAGEGKTLIQKYWWLPRFMHPLMQNMLAVDGDDHARLRGLVERAFARVEIAEMRPRIGAMADGLLDRIDPSKPVEMINAYARPLPLMAICDLLGVPAADRDRVSRWIAPISGPTNSLTLLRGLPGLWQVLRHFRADFVHLRRNPRAGLIGDLVAMHDDGDYLSDDELLAMVFTLFVAGHETTVHLITMAILALTTLPHARTALRDSPDALPLLVEEVMRFYSPVMMTKPHFVTHDTMLDGVALKKGEQVAALLIGANHDPARFDKTEVFVPDRRPNAHLGFGHGPHVCLGMQLARAEAQVALQTLFGRFPDPALANPSLPPAYTQRAGIHGLSRLDLRLV